MSRTRTIGLLVVTVAIAAGAASLAQEREDRALLTHAQMTAPSSPSLPQEMNAEFNILIGQNKSVLEIRDFLSGEFTLLPLADLMAVLKAREAAGTIKLTPRK